MDIPKITKELKDTLTDVSAYVCMLPCCVAFSVEMVEMVPLKLHVKVFILHLGSLSLWLKLFNDIHYSFLY